MSKCWEKCFCNRKILKQEANVPNIVKISRNCFNLSSFIPYGTEYFLVCGKITFH